MSAQYADPENRRVSACLMHVGVDEAAARDGRVRHAPATEISTPPSVGSAAGSSKRACGRIPEVPTRMERASAQGRGREACRIKSNALTVVGLLA